MEIQTPSEWGKDEISSFIELGRNHSFKIFDGLKAEYLLFIKVDSLYKTIIDNLSYPKDWFSALFLLRTHSSLRAAINVCLTGQLPEAYMIIRGCLENALYGLFLNDNIERQKIWLKRNDSEEAKKKVKNEFQTVKLFEFLNSIDSTTGRVASALYEHTIDFGAHPNQYSLMTGLRISETEFNTLLQIAYISGDKLATQVCMKIIAHIGLCNLEMFKIIFKERFDILGISESIRQLKLCL